MENLTDIPVTRASSAPILISLAFSNQLSVVICLEGFVGLFFFFMRSKEVKKEKKKKHLEH